MYVSLFGINVRLREEVVDRRHNLRWAFPEKLAEAMVSVFLSLFQVVQYTCCTMSFVNPAKSKSHVYFLYLIFNKFFIFFTKNVPDIRVHKHVPCELKNTHTSYKRHSCHQRIHLYVYIHANHSIVC